jgi:hypothetical protein
MTQTQSIGMTNTQWTQTLLFNQWDSTLYPDAELTSVSISLSGAVSNHADWAITAGEDVTISMIVNAIIRAYRTWDGNTQMVSTTPSGSVFRGPFDAPRSGSEDLLGTSLPNLYNTTQTADLGAFTGAGTIGILAKATGQQGYQIMGTDAAGSCVFQTTKASAVATVTYTWEVVPEPASCATFLLGVLGLGLYSRRRRGTG